MKKKIIIGSICLICLICVGLVVFYAYKPKDEVAQNDNGNNNNSDDEISMENSTMYQDDATVSQLKEEYKMTGENDLYEVQTEYDGRKVLVIKPNIDYKVAFAGAIKKSTPQFSEIDTIFEENYPKKSGVWVEKDSQEKILDYLQNSDKLQSKYSIDEDGYLKVSKAQNESDFDKKLDKIIESKNSYVLAISGTSYMVDVVTGEIVDNPYESMESDQTYEYVENENNKIIFITENVEKKLTDNEIFESIVNLLEN